MTSAIYKIVPTGLWRDAERAGIFEGAPVDLRDGYIHFSTAGQTRETARRHFRGGTDLVLVAVDVESLGSGLRWEPSRGGELFPHLYAPLPMDAVVSVTDLPLGDNGEHIFPDAVP